MRSLGPSLRCLEWGPVVASESRAAHRAVFHIGVAARSTAPQYNGSSSSTIATSSIYRRSAHWVFCSRSVIPTTEQSATASGYVNDREHVSPTGNDRERRVRRIRHTKRLCVSPLYRPTLAIWVPGTAEFRSVQNHIY
jgi:hypothetical protein